MPACAQYPGTYRNQQESCPTGARGGRARVDRRAWESQAPAASYRSPSSTANSISLAGSTWPSRSRWRSNRERNMCCRMRAWPVDFLTSTPRRMWTATGLAMARGSQWLLRPSGRAEARQEHAPGGDRCGERPAAFQEPGFERKQDSSASTDSTSSSTQSTGFQQSTCRRS